MQQFHAFEVQPGKTHKLTIPIGCGFHLSIASFAPKSTAQTTLYAFVGGKSFAIATLDSTKNILQVSLDLIFNAEQDVSFTAKGGATIHCIGYVQELDQDDEGFPLSDDDEENEENGQALQSEVNTRLPIEGATGESQSNEQSEDEELDSDDLENENMAADEEGESDDDEDEDDEEMSLNDEEESDADLTAMAGGAEDEEDSDDDDDEKLDDEELDEEDESDDEEEEQPVRKSARMEGQTAANRGSPAKAMGGSSPQGRPSQGTPQRFSQDIRKSGGSPQSGKSPKFGGGSPKQGRRSN